MKHFHIRRISNNNKVDYFFADIRGNMAIFSDEIHHAREYAFFISAIHSAEALIGHNTYPVVSSDHLKIEESDLEIFTHSHPKNRNRGLALINH